MAPVVLSQGEVMLGSSFGTGKRNTRPEFELSYVLGDAVDFAVTRCRISSIEFEFVRQ